MLLPTMLPIAMSALPFLAAVTDVNSSGREVPRATIVRPIKVSLHPIAFAIVDAPETTKSPPNFSATTPKITATISFNVDNLYEANQTSLVHHINQALHLY